MKSGRNVVVAITAIGIIWAVASQMNGAQPKAGAGGGTLLKAAAAGGARVAVVDLVKVFNEFEQTKAVNQKMQDYRNKLNQESDKKVQEIKTEEQALENFDPNAADYHTRSQKVKRMKLEYGVWESLEKDYVTESYMSWVKRTYKAVTDGIAEVAKKNGVQLVITQEQVDTSVSKPDVLLQQILNRKVVYSDDSLDMTAEVLATLNAAFAKAGGPASVQFGK
jgi:Skp family chaperone for outer membrane proteins